MEKMTPYLDKSQQVKKLVDENKEQLKQGNAMELVQKIKDSVSSGNSNDLQSYIQEAVKKTKSSAGGGSIEHYFSMVSGSGSIWSNLSQLQEGAQKHGKEAEKLFKEAL